MIKPLLYGLAVCGLLVATPAGAALIRSGFFAGMDMTPMQGTTMRQLDGEPAAVLLFSPDAASIDETAKFDQWYRDPERPKINAFAVSVGPEETPFDVIAEVLRQRELQVPTFHVRGGNLLQGKEFRLLLLDNGGQVRRAYDEIDLAVVEAELGFRRNSPPAPDAGALGAPGQDTTAPLETEPAGPLYRNQQFQLQVEFPANWPYRVAKSNDGAVAKSPGTARLDLRVWALPDQSPTAIGGAAAMVATSPVQYIDDYLSGIGDLNRTRVSVDRRLVVEDDDIRGRDYIYSYLRLLDPEDPASGSTRFRGRVQVFVHGGYIKAAAAEGPAGEFDAMMQEIVEPFFLSFHPKLEPVGGEEGRNGGEAVPSSAAPNRPRVNEGARTPSQTRYF